MPRIVFISDTHNFHHYLDLPPGDILIHAGDLTGRGTAKELIQFAEWIKAQKFKEKIIIAGNHDFCCQIDPQLTNKIFEGISYLKDEGTEVGGVSFYGSPWQPWFHDWAFNLNRGPEITEVWKKIPLGLDFLITHGPPSGILDLCAHGERVGCTDLLDRILEVKPKYHLFGHIHESYGTVVKNGVTFINGSSCNLRYQITNPPIIIDL